MNWERLMERERHRWSYMTDGQLERRLYKITNLDKLRAFYQVAEDVGDYYLSDLAMERKIELGHTDTFPVRVLKKYKMKGSVVLPTGKEMMNEDRYLDI